MCLHGGRNTWIKIKWYPLTILYPARKEILNLRILLSSSPRGILLNISEWNVKTPKFLPIYNLKPRSRLQNIIFTNIYVFDIMYLHVLPVCIHISLMSAMPAETWRGCPVPPVLELQMDKSNHVGAGRQIKVFLKSNIWSLPLNHLLSNMIFLTFINSYYEEILHV